VLSEERGKLLIGDPLHEAGSCSLADDDPSARLRLVLDRVQQNGLPGPPLAGVESRPSQPTGSGIECVAEVINELLAPDEERRAHAEGGAKRVPHGVQHRQAFRDV
jgi:hypothetical protein